MTTAVGSPAARRTHLRHPWSWLAPALLAAALAAAAYVTIRTTDLWLVLTVGGLATGLTVFPVAAALTLVLGLALSRFGSGAPAIQGTTAGARVTKIVLLACLLFVAYRLPAVIGAEAIVPRPRPIEGTVTWRGVVLDRLDLIAIVAGFALFFLIVGTLRAARTGLILRAALEDAEMTRAMGHRLCRIFAAVVMAALALALLGCAIWGMREAVVTSTAGGELMILTVSVVMIGGLGSVSGALLAALLVGLTHSYAEHLLPDVPFAGVSALLVLILIWRPFGLLQVANRHP